MERKYQLLVLFQSGQLSLTDLKSMYRATYVAATDEYSSPDDQKKALATKARLDKLARLTETRDIAKTRVLLKLKPKVTMKNREDAIASMATGHKGDKGWKRYSPMVTNPKRYNPPRYGSSKGRIGKTTYSGFEAFNKDFDNLMRALTNLARKRGGKASDISKRLKSVKAGVSATINSRKY
tara:strand:+ start:89 stop:631 length:543 start_codon:yes stop_codon:yes gene_type:complete